MDGRPAAGRAGGEGMTLRGMRIIDITSNVAGPFTTMILADLGADVIKVEHPDRGDDTRSWGPPFWGGSGATFLALNRNKRSIGLDVKSDSGRAVLDRLLETADAFVTNLRPAALRRLSLGYACLASRFPRLVVCEMTGYGNTGPRAGQPAFDALMQAYSGIMSLTSPPGAEPVRVPVSLLDQGMGMWGAIGVMSALLDRDRTGRGSQVETSLLHTALMWVPTQITSYLATGKIPRGWGSGISNSVPYQAFPTQDGHVLVSGANDGLFRRFCDVLNRRDLAEDPRFRTNPDRVANRDLIVGEISRTMATRPTADWIKLLQSVGVPAAPIQNIADIVVDEQVTAVEAIPAASHPLIPGYRTVALPVRTDGALPPVHRVPPMLGQDTREILAEVGLTDDEARQLISQGVAVAAGDGQS